MAAFALRKEDTIQVLERSISCIAVQVLETLKDQITTLQGTVFLFDFVCMRV